MIGLAWPNYELFGRQSACVVLVLNCVNLGAKLYVVVDLDWLIH